jgi:hypothetical protein
MQQNKFPNAVLRSGVSFYEAVMPHCASAHSMVELRKQRRAFPLPVRLVGTPI